MVRLGLQTRLSCSASLLERVLRSYPGGAANAYYGVITSSFIPPGYAYEVKSV